MSTSPHGAWDRLAFTPNDVDLTRSPLAPDLAGETYVMGAFNPGFTRLPNGNLLMMVRVAEALREPVHGGQAGAIRWTGERYVVDKYDVAAVDMADPRKFTIKSHSFKTLALTSLSWLLPVELSADGAAVIAVHYDKIISPRESFEQYGIEDARISHVGDTWYMTACSVSPERHCTTLFTSPNGVDYVRQGIILDHQNKDMLIFEGKVGGRFMAMTRPMGDLYFTYAPDSDYLPGPCIQFAESPDALHWRPIQRPGIRPRKGTACSMKVGGGTPPIRTGAGWLTLFHGVEVQGVVGVYRTFWALLDHEDPSRILRLEDTRALLEASPQLTAPLKAQMYLDHVVFSCGIVDDGDAYIVASGEADLACRLTRMPKTRFA